ncbi:Metallophosphoesterase MPPED2 [Camelus dromedarius]|uniref:Metallophosphoesterase MPPED2 n=1 Tax=Camelus dromedarius TaxID=9838 RepID=A0A5N4DLU1_CAMDR|nr:Metallophosphoesterase MPPED2 [Camelus dromedarius]
MDDAVSFAPKSVPCHSGPFCLCISVSGVDPIPYDTPKPAGHTRFVCISDTHSRTDGIQMPYGDILLHTGDFTELGLPSEVKKFNDWLADVRALCDIISGLMAARKLADFRLELKWGGFQQFHVEVE